MSCKKIILSCFYLQIELDNYEQNYQLQVLSEILQRMTLYQVSFDSDFLEIDWLIESRVVLKTKNKRVWSLHRTGFSKLMASNSRVTLTEVKNTQKTHKCPKKEIDNCHSTRRLQRIRNRKCSTKWSPEKHAR